jgi:hypothetical protein
MPRPTHGAKLSRRKVLKRDTVTLITRLMFLTSRLVYIYPVLPLQTLAGFDLTTHSFSLLGGRQRQYHATTPPWLETIFLAGRGWSSKNGRILFILRHTATLLLELQGIKWSQFGKGLVILVPTGFVQTRFWRKCSKEYKFISAFFSDFWQNSWRFF